MRGKSILSFAASVPMILPAVVVGLGLRVVVIKLNFLHLYGSRWVFCLAYVPLIIPFALRYVEPAMLQISSGLEEAAWCSGARWTTSSRKILVPLLKTSLISAWLLGFLFAMRELGASVMLFTLSSQTIGVQLLSAFANDGIGQTAAFSAFVGGLGLVVAGLAIVITRRFLWGHNEAPDEARTVEGTQ
jgi:iron(III) transport system permease protein